MLSKRLTQVFYHTVWSLCLSYWSCSVPFNPFLLILIRKVPLDDILLRLYCRLMLVRQFVLSWIDNIHI